MANAFSTQGATPNGVSMSSIKKSSTSLNPMTKALESIAGKYGGTTSGIPLMQNPAVSESSIQKATSTPQVKSPVISPVVQKTAPTSTGMINTGSTYQPPIQSSNTAIPMPTYPTQSVSSNMTQTPQVQAPTYAGLVGNLAERSGQPSEEYLKYQNEATRAQEEAAGFGAAVKQGISDVKRNPEYSIDTGVGLGNRIAETQGIRMEQLNKLAEGARDQAGLATTQQGLQQTGLTSAAGLAAPILGQYGQANYGIGGNTSGGVQPNDPFYQTLQNYAQLRATGQESLIPSSVTGNAMLNDQLTQMTKAINPSYNANTAGAQGQVQGQQYEQVQAYKSAHQQAQNLQGQLKDLITTFGLNPYDTNAANVGVQKIAQNTSDPRYKMLQNYMADIASRYAMILTPSNGSQTDTTRALASSMLDDTASGKSVMDVMNGLDQQAQAVIAGVQTINNQPTNSGSITWDNIFD